jgi:hypothetical protein
MVYRLRSGEVREVTFCILDININRNSQSWVSLLGIGSWELLYFEWDYNRKFEMVVFFGVTLYRMPKPWLEQLISGEPKLKEDEK